MGRNQVLDPALSPPPPHDPTLPHSLAKARRTVQNSSSVGLFQSLGPNKHLRNHGSLTRSYITTVHDLSLRTSFSLEAHPLGGYLTRR